MTNTNMNRRNFLQLGASFGVLAGLGRLQTAAAQNASPTKWLWQWE